MREKSWWQFQIAHFCHKVTKWQYVSSPQSCHLSGCVCVSYFYACPIFIRAMGNRIVQFAAWLISFTKFSSIFMNEQRWKKMTIKLCCMTEHCLLIGVVGFTTSGTSCLTEFLLSLKLSGKKESCQRKSTSWKNMFYKTLCTSVYLDLLCGCRLTCMAIVHGNIDPVMNKTRKNCAFPCTLCPDILNNKVTWVYETVSIFLMILQSNSLFSLMVTIVKNL